MKRRRLELAVLACGAVFLVILAVSFRPGGRPASGKPRGAIPAPPNAEASGEATTLLEGFDFTESVAGKPLMRIKADRTVGYGPAAGLAPNLFAGEKVALTLYPEGGAPVTVYADRAQYDERTRESRLEGNVRWLDRDGALAETSRVTFHPPTHTLEAPATVRFTQGATELTARSARYDLRERVVRFAGPVEGVATGNDPGGISRLTARSGLFRRDEGAVELEAPDAQTRAGDRFAADTMLLKLGGSGGHPEWARSTGNVRGLISAAGAARVAPARGAENVAPARGAENVAPARGAQNVAPARGAEAAEGVAPPDRQYAGDEGLMVFDADGDPQSFTLSGAPALLTEPGRRVSARRISVRFRQGRAESAEAEGGVRLDSESTRAEAEKASLGFTPGGVTENLQLTGAVKIDADGRSGEAARVVELAPAGVWVLSGDASGSARVASGASRLSADRIEIVRAAGSIRATGRARAVFAPDSRKKSRTVPFVGDPKKPAFGKGDRIVLDEKSGVATLSGSASVWQDDSSLFADDITISDGTKTLTAVGGVRAVLTPSPGGDAKAARKPRTPGKPGAVGGPARPPAAGSVVTAKRLHYRDSDRAAKFEGGVTVHRGGWSAEGAETTAWLNKDGDVESVEVTGNVRMSDRATGRTGEADKALDYPKLGKTVLWGNPARVADSGGNKVAGAVLTIFDRGGSVEVTAPEGGKTETIHRTSKD